MLTKQNAEHALIELRYAIKDNAEQTQKHISHVQQVINWLDQFVSGDIIATVWAVEDVDCALEMEQDANTPEADRKTLTLEQKRQVLQNVDENHDAEYGITWYTIQEEVEAIL
jgi:hypothetical protein